jgi:hypothetical protein
MKVKKNEVKAAANRQASERTVSKSPGTRTGMLEDWRQGGRKPLTGPNRRGTGYRDGQ